MLRVISLYTGVGGLDFGFEAAGFQTRVGVEMDSVACRTVALNRKWPLLEGDIHGFTSEDILAAANLRSGEADILIGGPPCQPFSKSGYWANGDAARLDDPRADTLTAYLRVLRDTRPRSFLLENVHGLAFKGKDEGLRYLLEGIEAVNRQAGTRYSVTWQKLNAAEYGVPQFRERVFLVGARDGAPFAFPAPTHCSPEDARTGGLEPYRTAWDAIGDLPAVVPDPSLEVKGKWGGLLPTIPEGWNYLWHTKRGGGESVFGWRTRYWSFLLKLKKSQPSWTIQAQPGTATGPFHWANRRLSAHELCRLQTLPHGIVFDCGRNNVQKMLGNAVPSLLAEVLAREIQLQLLGTRPKSRRPKLMPPRLVPVPPETSPAPFPPQFRRYIGERPDHPGEGLGSFGRLRRAS